MRRRLAAAKFLLAIFFTGLLLIWPGQALISAQSAMRTWAFCVAPALFPFLTLLPMLTCSLARRAYERFLGKWMRPLFGLPGAAAASVVTGMIAGSPAGALAARNASGGMRKCEFTRMALMGSGVGPVYLVSGVGVALFGSVELGVWLAGAQWVSQILTGVILRRAFREEQELLPEPELPEMATPIRAAIGNVLQVCGYMVCFSVAAGLLSRIVGEQIGNALLYFLDLPSGMAAAARAKAGVVTTGLIAGFGGMCIATQNMAVLRPMGIRWREYFAARGFCAAMTAGTLFLRFRVFAPEEAVMAIGTAAKIPAMEISMLAAILLAIPGTIFLAKRGKS